MSVSNRRLIVVGSSFLLVALLLAPGCGKRGGQPSGGPVTLNGAGATFPYPIYSKWFDAYKQKTGVTINYQSIGSGGGIKQLQQRTVDFGASDAPLSDQELKEMPAPVMQIPTVAGAVVIAYNLPGLQSTLRLDGPSLAAIYMGQITKWNDPKLAALNPGVSLPATDITVAHRSDGSGTSYLFTTYLSAVSLDWKSKVGAGKSVNWPVGIGGKGNEGVTGVVKQTAGGIGYVELAYAKQNKLKYALLKNAAGKFVEPTAASTTAAATGFAADLQKNMRTPIVNSPAPGAYPIAGLTYILVYKDQPDQAKGEALVNFLAWAMDEGQKEAEPLGYAPLPDMVRERVKKPILFGITYQGHILLPPNASG